jgi:hypothetical protein
MAKTLKEMSDELKTLTKDVPEVNISKKSAKQSAEDLQRQMYEAEKKTGAPVPNFKAGKALD